MKIKLSDVRAVTRRHAALIAWVATLAMLFVVDLLWPTAGWWLFMAELAAAASIWVAYSWARADFAQRSYERMRVQRDEARETAGRIHDAIHQHHLAVIKDDAGPDAVAHFRELSEQARQFRFPEHYAAMTPDKVAES